MGRVHIKANLIVRLFDTYADKYDTVGRVTVVSDDGRHAIKKDMGCYVMVNLPQGRHLITVISAYYQRAVFSVDTQDDVQCITVPLLPAKGYRFSDATTFLRGSLPYEEELMIAAEEKEWKIAEGCKKGKNRLRIYSGQESLNCGIPVLITDGNHRDVVCLAEGERDMEYVLEKPAGYDIGSGSVICHLFCVKGDTDDKFFLGIKGRYEKVMLIYKGRQSQTELEERETNISIMQIFKEEK